MTEAINRVFQKEFAEERGKGRQEGVLDTLAGLVKDGMISLTEAARRANMTPADFQSKISGLNLKK